MRNTTYLLVAIALLGVASAVELSNTNMSLSLFKDFLQEDLVPPVETFMPNGEAWDASQGKVVGAFDYSEVADMTNALDVGNRLVRVGNLSDGQGHYLDGTKNYIQP